MADTAEAVRGAHARIHDAVIQTPLIRLPWLDAPGREVWAKLECWQYTGSFKVRGALNALLQLSPGSEVITASAGNHGLAVATVAAQLGLPCRVCIPLNASELKLRRLGATGAEIIPVGRDLFAATAHAEAEASKTGEEFVSAFANWDVVAGQGTCALEALTTGGKFDTVLVPLGGGGLLAGVGSVIRGLSPWCRTVGVYPASFGRHLSRGRLLEEMSKPAPTTIADGLAVQVEADNAIVPLLADVADDFFAVSEQSIETAVYVLLHSQALLVEGGGAVGVAALLDDWGGERFRGRILTILSGGNISSTRLAQAMSVDVPAAHVRKLLGLRSVQSSLELNSRGAPNRGGRLASREPCEESDGHWVWRDLVRSVHQQLDVLEREIAQHSAAVSSMNLRSDEQVMSTVAHHLEEARRLAHSCDALGSDEAWRLRARFRWLLQEMALLRYGLDWCSASTDQSREVMFFDPADLQAGGVNYARYGSASLREAELRVRDATGFSNEAVELLATSSGSAAFQLIEAFLTRDVLRQNDRVVYAPYVYFEAREHFSALPFLDHITAESYDPIDLAESVEATNARVLFVDPMANIAGLPTVDLRRLAARTRRPDWRDRWIVIDGTMVSGGINPFSWFGDDGPTILYYESGSKYLQFGLDLQMAGICVAPRRHLSSLVRHRRNTGSVMYPRDVARFPVFNREHLLARMRAITRNAEALCAMIVNNVPPGEVIVGYPARWRELEWEHGGGVVTVTFRKPGGNNRDRLEGFITRLLHAACAGAVPLTKGVSFGFSTTRVSAAAAMAESTDPFLRFSVGEETPTDFARLCEVLAPVFQTPYPVEQ